MSRVLNDYPFVSEDVRRRVLQAMGELDYRPDMAARSMRTGTSLAVGFVVSDISNPLFSAIAKGADAVLHPHGYALVLANSGNDPEREAELISALRQRRVEGLIAAVADEHAATLGERLQAFPGCVLFDREIDDAGADAVLSDHESGMSAALGRLSDLGHRRVALIAGGQRQLGSRARMLAHREHVTRLRLDRDQRLVQAVDPSRENGYVVVRELLEADDPPTALIVAHNQLAVGVIEALRDAGVRVPDDVSLVACDDVDVIRLHNPPIDVISRDLLQLGRSAAQVLLDRLDDRSAPPRRLVLPTQLIVRGSTAAPAVRGVRP